MVSGRRHRFAEVVASAAPGEDLVAVGADLSVRTLVDAYCAGLFPMGLGEAGTVPIGWWSPDPRGVLPLDGFHASRSLRAAARRFEIRVDTAFEQVVAACGDPARSGAWITDEIATAYLRLHAQGWAHSVECWQSERLVGGVYGVAIAGLFAGESMFHHTRDASKVALMALVGLLARDGETRRLFDVQWSTPHLRTLGVVDITRPEYLARLRAALECPAVRWPHGPLRPA